MHRVWNFKFASCECEVDVKIVLNGGLLLCLEYDVLSLPHVNVKLM